MDKLNAMNEFFEEVTVFDRPAFFTPARIDSESVPPGCYLYEVRHDDDGQGDAVQIAKSIHVNHWGSLITLEEIQLPPDGYLDINPNDINYGVGGDISLPEFIAKYRPESKPHTSLKTFFFTMKIQSVLSRSFGKEIGMKIGFYRDSDVNAARDKIWEKYGSDSACKLEVWEVEDSVSECITVYYKK